MRGSVELVLVVVLMGCRRIHELAVLICVFWLNILSWVGWLGGGGGGLRRQPLDIRNKSRGISAAD